MHEGVKARAAKDIRACYVGSQQLQQMGQGHIGISRVLQDSGGRFPEGSWHPSCLIYKVALFKRHWPEPRLRIPPGSPTPGVWLSRDVAI